MIRNQSTDADILQYPHPILPSKCLKKGVQQVTLFNKKYVLFRNKEGQPVALPDACPHRGALLSKGKVNQQGELVCAYHAWRIGSNGAVACPSVPKRSCTIKLLKTWEQFGFIWIANPEVSDECLPDFATAGYEFIGCFSSLFKAPLKVVLDNFGEIEHAFQVHKFIGPSKKRPDHLDFSVDIQEDKTLGFLSCKFRTLPFFMRWFFGFKRGDLYHNDWVFQFRPLHGSYSNYWTDPAGVQKRPVSFIITSFLVPVNDHEVKVQVFVQMAVKKPLLKLMKPLLKFFTMLLTKFEIRADSHIASFAPENAAEGSQWRLTYLDKQIMANRKKMETIYFGKDKGSMV